MASDRSPSAGFQAGRQLLAACSRPGERRPADPAPPGQPRLGRRRLARGPRRPTARGVALLMVLAIVSVIFIIGLGAITAATVATKSGENFAAVTAALQTAQSGVEVARRRLSHPWEVNLTWGQDWPGTGGFLAMPTPTDGRANRWDLYYSVTNVTAGTTCTVTSTGLAVRPGGSATLAADVLATRTVRAVFKKPVITLPHVCLSASTVDIPTTVYIGGDLFSNDDARIRLFARVAGKVSAVGSISNFGVVDGGTFPGVDSYPMPDLRYDMYRPTYSYGGATRNATHLTGSYLDYAPALGMPNNPDNVFYNESNYELRTGASINPGTLVVKGNLTINGTVTLKGRPNFPALVVHGDVYLTNKANLTSEGLVHIRGAVIGASSSGQSPTAKWRHSGPLVFGGSGTFSTSLLSDLQFTYRSDRVNLQPVSKMVVPVPLSSYSEP